MNEIKLSIKVRRPTYVSSRIKIFSSQLCRVFLNFRARSLSGTLLHIFAPIRENKFFIWLMVRSRVFNRVSRQAKVILRKWDFFPLAFRNSFFQQTRQNMFIFPFSSTTSDFVYHQLQNGYYFLAKSSIAASVRRLFVRIQPVYT